MTDDPRADGPIRVLVVDDHEVVRAGLRMLLGREPGIEVVGEASDGSAAQDAVARTAPDVVLMDLSMPGMDGVELALETVKLRPGIGLLLMSGYAELPRHREADALGVRFISKPFSINELMAILSLAHGDAN